MNLLRKLINIIPIEIRFFCSLNFFSSLKYRIKQKQKNHVAHVIMSGPSLFIDDNFAKEISNDEVYVSNHFADTSYFVQIKPKNYVLLDKYFWNSDVREEFNVKRLRPFKELNEKTTWKLKIFIPDSADLNVLEKVINNKNIEFIRFHTNYAPASKHNIQRHMNMNLLFLLWKKNLASPQLLNVGHTTIYLAYLFGATKIYIHGIELSYFKDFAVNRNNDLIHEEKYFYQKKMLFKNIYSDKVSMQKQFVHQELFKWAYVFEGYYYLSNFLKENDILVINKTAESYLDVFERE